MIVRHGESEEDQNPSIKSLVDDPAKLTPRGRIQAKEKLFELLPEYDGFSNYLVYHSPSARVRETAEIFLDYLQPIYCPLVKEEPSIRNLNWGKTTLENVKNIEAERYKVGVLNFQFPEGDHTPTYVRNIELFCAGLLVEFSKFDNVCTTIFTHGFAQRVIAKCLLGISNEEFRYLSNPKNCYSCVIDVKLESTSPVLLLREPLPTIKFNLD